MSSILASDNRYDEILNPKWDYKYFCPPKSERKVYSMVLFMYPVRKMFVTHHYGFKAIVYDDSFDGGQCDVIIFIHRQYFEKNGINKGYETSVELDRLSMSYWYNLPLLQDKSKNSKTLYYYADTTSYSFMTNSKNTYITNDKENTQNRSDGTHIIKKNHKIDWKSPGSNIMVSKLDNIILMYTIPVDKKTIILKKSKEVPGNYISNFMIKPDIYCLDPIIPAETYETFMNSLPCIGLRYSEVNKEDNEPAKRKRSEESKTNEIKHTEPKNNTLLE